MAEVIPKKDDIIHAEALALGSSAETLASAGATIQVMLIPMELRATALVR